MSITPGPWRWVREGCTLLGAEDEQVLCIDLPEFISDDNKRVLAAAPDLLDAAQNAIAFLKCIEWNTDHDADDADNVLFLLTAAVANLLTAAVAKAKSAA